MSDPTTVRSVPSTPNIAPPAATGTQGPPPLGHEAGAEAIADEAARQVDELRSSRRQLEPLSHGRAVSQAVQTLARQGTDGLERMLRREPRALAALARYDDASLARVFARGLDDRRGAGLFGLRNRFESQSAAGMVSELVQDQARSRVHKLALAGVSRHLKALEAQRDNPAALVAALRDAPRGTAVAALAEHLGIDGSAADQTRVEHYLDQANGKLREFKAHLFGSTWEPSDFPASRRRAIRTMGMQGAAPSSIAGDAFGTPRRDTEQVANNLISAADQVDLALSGYALGEATVGGTGLLGGTEALAALGPVGVGIAGIAFGVAVSRAIDENRAERQAFARQLGL